MKQFARKPFRERLAALDDAIRALRKSPDQPDAVHKVRVSIRRTQQCLRLFKCFFDAKPAKKFRRRLRRLMDRCGEVRNWDIAKKELTSARRLSARLGAYIEQEREVASERLVRQLERWRGQRSARAWKKRIRIQHCEWDSTAWVNDIGGWFDAGDRAVDGNAQELHRLRLLGKRLRYTLELLDDDSPHLDTLKRVQDELGAINDCATTQALIP
jgi:CHAD domain-containing protein